MLVSTFSKLYRKLTSRVQKTRFWCARSSTMNSISTSANSWCHRTRGQGTQVLSYKNWVCRTRFHLNWTFFCYWPPRPKLITEVVLSHFVSFPIDAYMGFAQIRSNLGFARIGPGFCWSCSDRIKIVRKVLLELIGLD